MRYVLIDLDGAYQTPAGADPAQELFGADATRVPLAPLPDGLGPITGWVGAPNAPANLVGGRVLVALGAVQTDYFGPVVITGWDATTEQVRGLNSDQAYVVQTAHAGAQQ